MSDEEIMKRVQEFVNWIKSNKERVNKLLLDTEKEYHEFQQKGNIEQFTIDGDVNPLWWDYNPYFLEMSEDWEMNFIALLFMKLDKEIKKAKEEERERIRKGIWDASKHCHIGGKFGKSFPKRDEFVHTNDIFDVINEKSKSGKGDGSGSGNRDGDRTTKNSKKQAVSADRLGKAKNKSGWFYCCTKCFVEKVYPDLKGKVGWCQIDEQDEREKTKCDQCKKNIADMEVYWGSWGKI